MIIYMTNQSLIVIEFFGKKKRVLKIYIYEEGYLSEAKITELKERSI